MKKIGFLIIIAALGVFGSAFLGFYTAPGLEDFPTAEGLGLIKKQPKKAAVEKTPSRQASKQPAKPGSGPFRSNPNGATAQRNAYLQENQQKVAPGSK